MKKQQERVKKFLEQNNLETKPENRLLDLLSELGEVAKDMNESTDYGEKPEELSVKEDEIGDTLFALLALSENLNIDAEQALDKALKKYRNRMETSETPSSN